jgi:hypothetical protein
MVVRSPTRVAGQWSGGGAPMPVVLAPGWSGVDAAEQRAAELTGVAVPREAAQGAGPGVVHGGRRLQQWPIWSREWRPL